MDQPYSRIADTLLDRQYWSPKDKYDTPHDDTGWSMGDLFGVQVARVTDATILDASMERVEGPIAVPQGLASVDVPDAGKPLPRIALMHTRLTTPADRKSVVEGKRGYRRVDSGGCLTIKKKK